MKKKILLRCLLGAPLGLAISTIITIFISYAMGDGSYYAVVPELVRDCGSEINAVALQAVCSLLYGAAWAGASLIWEADGWSLLKMTVTHLLICSLATFPVAYLMRWMDHSLSGIALYFGIFLATYAVIWITQYSAMKRKIDELNSSL
ncbi:MAG: DUF3021 domain-containing protein [Oscillospiraceae bacterium]|nr:DUF3021 domain-containing protein [Oscillospiraceae bacterium]